MGIAARETAISALGCHESHLGEANNFLSHRCGIAPPGIPWTMLTCWPFARDGSERALIVMMRTTLSA
jgi:hypothetical protein